MEELVVLVRRTQSGDLDAYGEIVRRFQDMAYGYGYSILGDFSAAEDAAQESFIKAYKELANLREPEAFPGWFRRIVYTRCAMIARRNHLPTVPLDDASELPSAGADPQELAEQTEMRDRVLGAIRALPENERVVTALFYINGYSHNDIAGFLEVPLSTVKSRLHTARTRLKKRMVDMVSESLHSSKLPEDFGRRVISNIPTLAWGRDRECTFAGSLEAALSVTDRPFDYGTIMGATGLAFRVRWFQGPDDNAWSGSSPVGEFAEDVADAAQAVGWKLRIERFEDLSRRLGESGVETFGPMIVTSISSGRPVLGYDSGLNMAVITGYEDGGKTVLMKEYYASEKEIRKPTVELPGFFIFLGERAEPLSPRDALLMGLKTAVFQWRYKNQSRTDRPIREGFYLYGIEALEGWAADIGLYDSLTEEQRKTLFCVSHWVFSSLCDARLAAINYLNSGSKLLDGPAREALEAAKAIYEQDVRLMGTVFTNKNAFLGVCSGNSIADWTPEMRDLERATLLKVRDIEDAATANIELALGQL